MDCDCVFAVPSNQYITFFLACLAFWPLLVISRSSHITICVPGIGTKDTKLSTHMKTFVGLDDNLRQFAMSIK